MPEHSGPETDVADPDTDADPCSQMRQTHMQNTRLTVVRKNHSPCTAHFHPRTAAVNVSCNIIGRHSSLHTRTTPLCCLYGRAESSLNRPTRVTTACSIAPLGSDMPTLTMTVTCMTYTRLFEPRVWCFKAFTQSERFRRAGKHSRVSGRTCGFGTSRS